MGWIYNYSVITLTNVTINDNTSTNGNGGGVWNDGDIYITTAPLAVTRDNGLGGGIFHALYPAHSPMSPSPITQPAWEVASMPPHLA